MFMLEGNVTHIRFFSPYNFVIGNAGSTYVKGTRNTKIDSLSQQACGVLDIMINGSTNIQQVDNNFEFGCHFGGPDLLSTLFHSFPCQFQPFLHTDIFVMDTLALKKEPFHKGYYIDFFFF